MHAEGHHVADQRFSVCNYVSHLATNSTWDKLQEGDRVACRRGDLGLTSQDALRRSIEVTPIIPLPWL